MADVQIAVIDPEDTQLALAAPAEAVVNVAVPGIQGPIGTTGSVTIAQAGTAATPGIRFESDTNTGIYSLGADQLAVSTGGTGRLFIDANGNVGVNVSSPTQARLVVASSTGANTAFFTDGTNSSIKFLHGGGGAVITTESGQYLAFGTSDAERMRLDSSGRVGIGTSSPTHKLDVAGGVNSTGLNVTGFGGFFNAANKFGVDNNAGATRMYSSGPDASTRGSYDFRATDSVGTLDTSRMVIDSTGRVGIGTSSPSEKLHILTSSNKDVRIANASHNTLTTGLSSAITFSRASDGTADLSALFGWNNGGVVLAAREEIVFANGGSTTYSATAERLRIDNAGQVLIGTTTFGSAGTSFSPIGAQVLHNNNTADTGVSLWCLSARPADTGRQFLYFQANTAVSPTVVFQVLNNGNTQNANGSFTSISDARLKENIVDSNSQWNDIKAIKIRNWNFKAETGLETHQQIGPVAQELELVCPGLVFEIFDRDADGNNLETATKGVNQSVLYMKAIKALQEAIARIETLEAAVAALQSA